MSEESLSALVDGELSAAELERVMQQLDDPQVRRRLAAFQRAREAFRSGPAAAVSLDFADRVMAQIGSELPQPALVSTSDAPRTQAAGAAAPRTGAPRTGAVAAPVRPRWRSGWAPVIGLAAAAGLGAVALNNIPALTSPDHGPAVAPAAVLAATAPRSTAQLRTVADDRRGTQRWADVEPEQARELNTYLIDYSNYRSAQGMGGTLGYARFAAHSPEAPFGQDLPQPEEQR